MKKNNQRTKLPLLQDTLRSLTTVDLSAIVGGINPTSNRTDCPKGCV